MGERSSLSTIYQVMQAFWLSTHAVKVLCTEDKEKRVEWSAGERGQEEEPETACGPIAISRKHLLRQTGRRKDPRDP